MCLQAESCVWGGGHRWQKRVSFPIYKHGLKLGRYLDEYELWFWEERMIKRGSDC